MPDRWVLAHRWVVIELLGAVSQLEFDIRADCVEPSRSWCGSGAHQRRTARTAIAISAVKTTLMWYGEDVSVNGDKGSQRQQILSSTLS